jgi:6-pyruvoyltetrahydropterin/6-carboxytetrahydropterin synthase
MDGAMERRGDFRVSVSKDYLVFASAHFITFAGHRCEGLHGHNYRARVTIEGALDEESWFVFDFVQLKHLMRDLCDAIDHKVLLPLQNPKIQVVQDGEVVRVAYEGQPRYLFPAKDCALLPVPNTTVEMLAEMLAGQLEDELRRLGARLGSNGLTTIEMEVEENIGQAATYRVTLGA